MPLFIPQRLLRVSLPPGATLYASDFREKLARDNSLPAEFFHYGESGNPLQGLPPIRTIGGKTWVGILATGEAAFPLLEQSIGPVTRVLLNEFRTALPIALEDHKLGIRPLDYMRPYFVRNMVSRRRSERMRSIPSEQLGIEAIKRTLQLHADQFALDVPTEDELALMVTQVYGERGMYLRTSHGTTKQAVHLIDLEFACSGEITGFWFFGNLTARGYGRSGLKRARDNALKEAA